MTGRTAGIFVMGAELALVTCLLAGVDVPSSVVAAAEALVLAALVWQVLRVRRLYAGGGWAAVRAAAPVRTLRLVEHEVRALHSLALWLARRRHGVGPGAYAAPYTGPQTAMLCGLLFVAVVETVMPALLIPWPAVHAVVLFLDVYTVIQVLGLHAACVTRPHVVGADGSLRIRYGGFYDVRVPAASVRSVRVERRYSGTKEDGVLGLRVGGQTTVTLELSVPVAYLRPLGERAETRTVRLHADDPRAFVDAVTRASDSSPA
ncbi:hypothetical protein ACWDZ4_28245 [Streptomyces sp. NPDC003016]